MSFQEPSPKVLTSAEARPPEASSRSAAARRKKEVDALKGLAIVGVLFAHMAFSSRLSASALHGIEVLQQWFGWCVIAFFFCAGTLARLDVPTQAGLLSFCLRRAQRLLIPCLLFSVTYKCLLVAVWHWGRLGQAHDFPSSLAGWIAFLLLPVAPQFYFLPYLFLISAASAIAVWLSKSIPTLAWCVSVMTVLFYSLQPVPLASYGGYTFLIPAYTLSYWLGLMVQRDLFRDRFWWATICASVVAGCLMRRTWVYAQALIPVLLYWAFQRGLSHSSVEFLGRHSGAIYVWHDPLVMPALSIAAFKLFRHDGLQVAVTVVATLGVSVILGQAVARVRYLRWYRF